MNSTSPFPFLRDELISWPGYLRDDNVLYSTREMKCFISFLSATRLSWTRPRRFISPNRLVHACDLYRTPADFEEIPAESISETGSYAVSCGMRDGLGNRAVCFTLVSLISASNLSSIALAALTMNSQTWGIPTVPNNSSSLSPQSSTYLNPVAFSSAGLTRGWRNHGLHHSYTIFWTYTLTMTIIRAAVKNCKVDRVPGAA